MVAQRSSQADSDLDNIWYYVARESGDIQTADRFIDSIVYRFALIGENPYLGRARDRDLRPGLRSFPVGDYLILYRLHSDDVMILRVLHTSRRIHDT